MKASLDQYPATLSNRPDLDAPAFGNIAAFINGLHAAGLIEIGNTLPLAESQAVLTDSEIAGRFEYDGAVKTPPRFAKQIQDQYRTAPFSFTLPFQEASKTFGSDPDIGGNTMEISGLRETHDVLTGFVERNRGVDRHDKRQAKTVGLLDQAGDMLENLTFIGEPEYQEGVRGLGVLWKAYLDADPRRKLCVLTEVNRIDRFREIRKSDEYVRDSVLATWTPEERERYSGRLVGDLDAMQDADLEFSKVVIVDDWSISGRQMRDNYAQLMSQPAFRRFAVNGDVEINVLAASEDRITRGLVIDPEAPESGAIPVKAYYRSHFSETSHGADHSYVTGLHSYVNYGFGDLCRKIAKKSEEGSQAIPALARVYPRYKVEPPRYEITGSQIRELRSAEAVSKVARVVTAIKRGGFAGMVEGAGA